MKKLTPEERKGLEAERRLIRLARSLRQGHPWLGRVRKAGTKHDQAGVDVIIHAYTITGEKPQVLPVALQVKSSWRGVREFHARHAEAVSTGVVPIVVNDNRTDRDILRDVAYAIVRGIFSKGRAERVQSFLRTTRGGQLLKR